MYMYLHTYIGCGGGGGSQMVCCGEGYQDDHTGVSTYIHMYIMYMHVYKVPQTWRDCCVPPVLGELLAPCL